MAQQGTSGTPPERRYDETRDPKNPPRAVVNPRARSAPLYLFLGGVLLLFLVVGIALIYVAMTGRDAERDELREPAAVGTTGQWLPGGFDPRPMPRDTEAELAYRGATETIRQGPMPPLTPGATPTDRRDEAIGSRVQIENAEVQARQGDTFWVRDGEMHIAIVAPDEAPRVAEGMRVDVTGVVEADEPDGTRIRATQVIIRE